MKMLVREMPGSLTTPGTPGRVKTATIATEAPVEVWDARRGAIVLEILMLDGCRPAPHIPLLCDHQRVTPATVGSVDGLHRNGSELLATLTFASGTTAADEVWQLVSQRHLRSLSVGYTIISARAIAPGRSETIGGKTFTAPRDRQLRIVDQWILREVSVLPIGADPGATIRSHVSTLSRRNQAMRSVFDILGRQASSMRFPQIAAAALSQRGQPIPESEADLVRAWLSSPQGLDDVRAKVNAAILDGYRDTADSLAGIVSPVDLPNYLSSPLAALTVHPRLEFVGRGSVAPDVAFAVSATSWKLMRFAAVFGLDEQCLIDGAPLGVYELALRQLGAAARRLVLDLLFSVILENGNLGDGVALFATDRGNYATGGGSALAQGSLDTGMAAIGGQVGNDEEGDAVIHLGLSPKYLLVPPVLFGTARRLISALVNGDEQNLVVRAESRLSASGVLDPRDDEITTGSDTNWLLTAPASQAPSLVLAGLNGQLEPRIREFELSQGSWGLGFDISLSVAAGAVDGKPLYFATGA